MKRTHPLQCCFVIVLALLKCANIYAAGEYPTYQGRLLNGTVPATGSYDIVAALYTSADTGSPLDPPSTNSGVAVSNGLFTITLPYGSSVFDGTAYYLELAVRTNGAGSFTTLTPRQVLAPAPNALYATAAGTATTVSSSGSVPLSALPTTVVTNGASGISISGSFTGSGSGLINLSPNSLTASGSQSLLPIIYSTRGIYNVGVPAGATNVTVKLWGAGGKSFTNGTPGGGGAFVSTTFPVSAGQICTVVVGASGTNGGGIGSGDASGGNGSFAGGTGGQASSVFLQTGGNYVMKAVAGGGGGGGQFGAGGAGGNPGGGPAGGSDGIGGGTSSSAGANYAAGATTTGLPSLSQMNGKGGDSFIVNAGGGGGGFGGGAGAGIGAGQQGSGGGSYGNTIIAGSGATAGNTADVNYQSNAGATDQDGLAVVIFSAPTVSFSNYVMASGFVGDGAFVTNLQPRNLVFNEASGNTAIGNSALAANTSGDHNTALGNSALAANTTGIWNTAIGHASLANNTTGSYNAAMGRAALYSNKDGIYNTALGLQALFSNTNGYLNVAVGVSSAFNTLTGGANTAVGGNSFFSLTNGYNNVGLGESAGFNLTSGNDNIYIKNAGINNEYGTIRIGTVGTHTNTYLTGTVRIVGPSNKQLRLEDTTYGNHWSIYTEVISGNPSSSGNLLFSTDAGAYAYFSKFNGSFGNSSDLRLKKDISDVGTVLDRVLHLRPVSYRFKNNADTDPLTFGFIAQEVEPLFPEVVSEVNGFKGISYSEMVPLTVGAIQELNQKLEKKDAEIAELKQSIAELKAAVDALSKQAASAPQE